MKTFVFIATGVVLLAWAAVAHRERVAECEARTCSIGKSAKLMQTGRYFYECLCVEVPR
mgnify:CR=1 FL=1